MTVKLTTYATRRTFSVDEFTDASKSWFENFAESFRGNEDIRRILRHESAKEIEIDIRVTVAHETNDED